MLIKIITFIYLLLQQTLTIYSYIWFIWIIISWLQFFGAINLDYYNPIVNFFYRITDGIIDKLFGNFRDKFIIGFIDISPLIFLIIINMVLPRLLYTLYQIVIRIVAN